MSMSILNGCIAWNEHNTVFGSKASELANERLQILRKYP